jgi:hypothetical protein
MKRYFWLAILGSILYLVTVGWQQTHMVWGLQNPTIPTRTPIPEPTDPPPKPTKSSNGGGEATAVPTSTTEAQATATATTQITPIFTPVDGYIPTAESCSNQPTIQALNPTNIRQGPGTDYAIVGTLAYLEVRFIQGRAAESEWWQIQLDNGETGWVADAVVTVHGFIGNVPIIPAPPITGDTPTPSVQWNPTSQPFCAVTPTATQVASLTPEPTIESVAVTETEESPTEESSVEDTAVSPTPSPSPTIEATQTAVSPPTLAPTEVSNQNVEQNSTSAVAEGANLSSAPPPSGNNAPRSSTDLLLPAAAILLLAGGAFSLRSRQKK